MMDGVLSSQKLPQSRAPVTAPVTAEVFPGAVFEALARLQAERASQVGLAEEMPDRRCRTVWSAVDREETGEETFNRDIITMGYSNNI